MFLPARAACLALALILAAGCASNTRKMDVEADSSEGVIKSVNKGDEVQILTRNGNRYRFNVTRITNKALYGEHYRVTYAEMDTLEVRSAEGGGPFKRIAKDIGSLF